jgi:hypothetical protein
LSREEMGKLSMREFGVWQSELRLAAQATDAVSV